MRDRLLTVLMLLALLSTAWFAGRWALATSAAPAGQLDPLRAAIHVGTCAQPDPEPAHVLEPFDRASGPGESDGPLSSFSELPVRLAALLDSPHVVLVTLGGDLAATLACGDIEDVSGGVILGIELIEQADSGVSGLGLILDDGTVTRVSVILDEPANAPLDPAASPVPQATPVVTAPTPEPGVAEPTPTPTPGAGSPIPLPSVASETPVAPTVAPGGDDPTPTPAGSDVMPDVMPTESAGVIPSIPIGLPPIAQGNAPEPSPEPTAVAGGELTEYASQEFGYSIAIPDGWSLVGSPNVRPGFDQILLTNGVSRASLTAVNDVNVPDAAACIDDYYGFLRGQTQTVLIVPHQGPESRLATRSPELTIELWDLVLLTADNEHQSLTYYNECRALGPGGGVLLLTHEAAPEVYAEQAIERDRLFGGLVMP